MTFIFRPDFALVAGLAATALITNEIADPQAAYIAGFFGLVASLYTAALAERGNK